MGKNGFQFFIQQKKTIWILKIYSLAIFFAGQCYQRFQLKNTKIVINATGNSAKKLLNLLRVLWGKLTLELPIYYQTNFFPADLGFLGPLSLKPKHLWPWVFVRFECHPSHPSSRTIADTAACMKRFDVMQVSFHYLFIHCSRFKPRNR